MGRSERRAPQYESQLYKELLRRLGGNVKRLRAARGWTQEEAAHQCGMALLMIQRAESGTKNLTMTTVARLCQGFAVDVRDLFKPKRR